MSAETFDVIVIGSGGVGSAAAMHLARRGVRVLSLDRFPVAHAYGSSHGQTRMIRKAYFEHPDYVPLLRRSYELWEDLEERSGEKLLYRVGVLQVGMPTGAVIPGALASAAMHGLKVENLSPPECMQRFPGFVVDEHQLAIFEPDAGYLLVERCIFNHLALAQTYGVELRTGVEVYGWRAEQHGVLVETSSGQYSADRLVITAGAWTTQLISQLGIGLRVLRKPLYWFDSDNEVYRLNTGSPCFLYDLPDGCFYGFPQLDEAGVKVAEHTGGKEISDPLNIDRDLDEQDLASVVRFVRERMPNIRSHLLNHSTCMYTMSPDEHFIVDRHPESQRVVFAAGLSGHGFKFTSVLGEILCDLALDGRTQLPIKFLSLERFNGNDVARPVANHAQQ